MSDPTGLNTKTSVVLVDLTNIQSRLVNMDSALGNIHSSLNDLNATLTNLSASLFLYLGTPDIGPASNLWDMLVVLYNQLACACGGLPPNPADPDTPCTDPLISNILFSVASADYANRVFANWDAPLPEGVNFESFLAHAVPGCELALSAPDNYGLYVQSGASSFSLDPEGTSALPTGVWLTIPGDQSIAINVGAGESLKAFLCVPSGFFDCVVRDSLSVTQAVTNSAIPRTDTNVNQFANLGGLGLSSTREAVAGTISVVVDADDVILAGDVFGWQIKSHAGDNIRIVWIEAESETFTVINTDSSTVYTVVPVHTRIFWVDNNTSSGASDHPTPITIDVCPPAA